LQEENDGLGSETTKLKKEIDELKVRLEETEWGLCQKSGELAHVKSQLKDTQSELSAKGHEVIALRSEIRDLLQKLESKERRIHELEGKCPEKFVDSESDDNHVNADNLYSLIGRLNEQVENELSKSNKLSDCGVADDLSPVPKKETAEPDSGLERFRELERHTAKLCRVLDEERKNWDQERLKWFQEKEKVLCYQRQLQMNYVQMFRRTQAFEAQIENLTVQMNVCSDHCASGKNAAARKAVKAVNAIKL